MKRITRSLSHGLILIPALPLVVVLLGVAATQQEDIPPVTEAAFTGSESCKACHDSFHDAWATSHHGLAMQPVDSEFVRAHLTPHDDFIEIDEYRYQALIEADGAYVQEWGPNGEIKHRLLHAMGGKNVFFFLTELDRGRLQTLPLAYDVHDKRWYDMAGSAVRHFAEIEDEALDWREPQFTFNTSCYGCHVSQLDVNYNLETDTYRTTWAEPGINCETCHGPAEAHILSMRALAKGEVPEEVNLIRTSQFGQQETNSMCAPCHAKMSPISKSFMPGDPFFDNFDIVTFEDPDFYPDGRDLGENYTYTGWRQNPCVIQGDMDCMHCHTSSGRYRFTEENANDACLPCHEQRVANAPAHTRHMAGSAGNRCISCHMPSSRFAAMMRSDHSLRPPAPAATIEFGSENACNQCHDDQTPEWADSHVRQWHDDHDYQAPILEVGKLVRAARKQEWDELPAMLEQITKPDRDEIFATSFIRILRANDDPRKWPAMLEALEDPSPLVRSAAADALSNHLDGESVSALIDATKDEVRLVRIRAASALAVIPLDQIPPEFTAQVEAATEELKTSLNARPDDTFSHYNLGNFHMAKGDYEAALDAYEVSAKLQPNNFLPLVNASLIYNMQGENVKAEASLRKAIAARPDNEAAYLNLALLLAELNRLPEAEDAFRSALEANPRSAVAAYNLGVLLLGRQDRESIRWCQKAADLVPTDPKYAYTLAYCHYQFGDHGAAIKTLEDIVKAAIPYAAAYNFLAQLYEEQGNPAAAIEVCMRGIANEGLSEQERYPLATTLQRLRSQ